MVHKIGEDTYAITLSGLDTNSSIYSIRRKGSKVFVKRQIPGGETLYQHMGPADRTLSLEGLFRGESAGSNADALENLFSSGRPHILDITDISTYQGTTSTSTGSIKFGKIENLNQEWRSGEQDLWWYSFDFVEVPGWGRVSLNREVGEVIEACDSKDVWTSSLNKGVGTDVANKKVGYASISGSYRIDGAHDDSFTGDNFFYVTFTGSGGTTGSKDLTRSQGIKFFWYITGSWNDVTKFSLQAKPETVAGADYYLATIPTIPMTGSWMSSSLETKDFVKTQGGAWDDVRRWTFYMNISNAATWGGCVWFDDVKTYGYGQEGIVITDLNLENGLTDLNPAWFKTNYVLNRTLKKLTEEFIIWNKATKTLPTTLHNCEQIVNWVIDAGTSSTLSLDTSDYMEGSGSLKTLVTTTAAGNSGVGHTFIRSLDLSNYEFLTGYVKPTITGSSLVQNFKIRLESAAGAWRQWNQNYTPNTWHRFAFPLLKGDETLGTVDMTAITKVTVIHSGSSFANTAFNFWIDDICVDYGNWARCEIQIPDHLSGSANWGWRVYSYSGSTYTPSPFVADSSVDYTMWYFMNGTSGSAYFNNGGTQQYGLCYYPLSAKGNVVSPNDISPTGSGDLTYLRYGTKDRIAFAVKLPPSTGEKDTSGVNAIDKLRCKLEIRYLDETFGWIDGSVTDS